MDQPGNDHRPRDMHTERALRRRSAALSRSISNALSDAAARERAAPSKSRRWRSAVEEWRQRRSRRPSVPSDGAACASEAFCRCALRQNGSGAAESAAKDPCFTRAEPANAASAPDPRDAASRDRVPSSRNAA